MTEIKVNREIWLDYSKAIGIVLVIIGHLALKDRGLTSFIYAFHMPLFFLVTGYLYKRETSINVSLKKDVKRLLLPYTYFYMINYVLWLVLFMAKHKNEGAKAILMSGFVEPMLGFLFGVGYETEISLNINHPIWFLIGLFVAKTIYLSLDRAFNGNKLLIGLGVAVLVAVIVLVRSMSLDLLFSIDSAILALPFFFFGTLFKQSGIIKVWFSNNFLNIIYFIALVALTLTIVYFNGRSDVNGTRWGNNLALFYVAGLTGTLMIFSISFILSLRPNKFILFFAANTIVLLGLQTKLKSISLLGLKIIGHRVPAKLDGPDAFLITFLVVILSLPISYIIDRYFPFLVGGTKKQIKSAI